MGIIGRVRVWFGGRDPLALEAVTYRPIGIVRNRVREARTHGWADIRSDLVFKEDLTDALDALDGFSHVIVVFHFHRIPDDERRPSRVPVAGEGARPEVGLLATRIPLRPNAIGVSVAAVVRRRKNVLRVRGLDALDGTPVLDIKPYLPRYDAVPDATLPPWAVRSDD